ncbi:hypothetical protein GJAV_G00181920 [Gymnothorax javanicus]|nr:hypothetical protein GJAV_G00181920 [Gymnothorax javanicus]
MRESRMSVESLSQPELLTLLSILEGELEARDLVIQALRAQRRDAFIQERYGEYNLSDPFLALQRDGEVMRGRGQGGQVTAAPPPTPLAVLKLVVTHCKRVQEKMLAQLAAAETRHRKVIADLEEEKRRHAQDTAEVDDVTCMLEKERERLLLQLGFERAQLKRLEKEQRRLRAQLEESRLHQKQASASLSRERANGEALRAELHAERAKDEALRAELQTERANGEALRAELEAERTQALRAEARAEEQLAEFDTEKEQLRAWLRREEGRGQEMRAELEELRWEVAWLRGGRGGAGEKEEAISSRSAAGETLGHKLNGHHEEKEPDSCLENGPHPALQPQPNPTPTANPASSFSLCSSPISSDHPAGVDPTSPSSQASYQAAINQRFHATRHKFQGQPEPPHSHQQGGANGTAPPPRDQSPNPGSLSSTSPPPSVQLEPASVKQLARHTVTQALSRFTGHQGGAKAPATNSSPFGTDYRSPPAGASSPPARISSPVSPGVKSPIIPRGERGNPPPIPPKKPGLAQTPMSPGPAPRAPHAIGCGVSSSQEGTKESDLLLSSTS